MIGATYQGITRADIYDRLARLADKRGSVDLTTHRLVAFEDAWMPAPASDLVCYPKGKNSGVVFDDGHFRIEARYQVSNAVGQSGTISRNVDTRDDGKATHIVANFPDTNWNRGYAKRTMLRSAELYQRIGLAGIEVTATELGKYIWPSCGFGHLDRRNQEDLNDAIATWAAVLGYPELPRYDRPWEYRALDVRSDGSEARVTLEALISALVRAGRLARAVPAPDPTRRYRPSVVLLVYNELKLWEGWFDLQDGSPSVRRLLDYTSGTP